MIVVEGMEGGGGGGANPIKLDYSAVYLASLSNQVRSFLCSHYTSAFIILCQCFKKLYDYIVEI